MLNKEFYSGAVIRLATLQKQRNQAGQLLFATVSLLPRDRPPSPSMKGLDKCPVGKTGQIVFFRRVLLNPQDAVDWYRSLGSANDKTPVPSQDNERDDMFDGIKLEIAKLTDDPTWPYLGLPTGDGLFAHPSGRSHPAPFIGNNTARIHRRFGSQDGFDLMLSDEKAVAFVERRLKIDLRLYKEYLGSVTLIAPDPVLKQIDNFMIDASDKRGERIFYRFVPRAGESLADLKLTTFDKQANLLTDFKTQDIPSDGILDIDKGDCIGAYGYVVTHQQHGVLAYSPPYPFLRQMSLSMHASTQGSRSVSTPINESKNSPFMKYPVAQHTTIASQSLIGDAPRIADITPRIATATLDREKIAKGQIYGQRWFHGGSREEAMRFVQSEIRRAKCRVIMADPYLAGLQLAQFLYAVNPENTKVSILTSGLAFKSKEQNSSKIDDFSQQLFLLEKNAKITANTYVLQPSMLHDRFLVIDDSVWFLGNSLNTLGDKASLIVKLPNPDEVIDQLERMQEQATLFENYKAHQSKAQGNDVL